MALRNAMGLAGAQTVVRILLGFVSAKVSAIYLGPSGTALLGQVTSFLQLVQGTIANGADTAVVSLTAERTANKEELATLWSTALRLVLTMACAFALLIALFCKPLSQWLLGDVAYWPVIIVAGVTSILAVADKVILGALNGMKQMTLIAKANIASAVLEVCLFATLVYHFGIWGGLFGIAGIYSIKLAVTSLAAFRTRIVTTTAFREQFDSSTANEIMRFYPMLLANAIIPTLADILVRNSVIGNLGLEQAGYLQATWRLSNIYVGVFTTAMGMFFLAHYSALTEDSARAFMLRRTAFQLFLLTTVAASTIYFLRDWIIALVLTRQFLPLGDLLPMHLLGDVLKMAYYPLQMALVVQRRTSWYITQAAAGPTLFVLLSYELLPMFGVQAAPIAYALFHFLVLLFLCVAQRQLLFRRH